MFFVYDSFPEQCKTQEICDRIVSENPFMLKYCHDRYKTQEMCDEAVDDCLSALKFVPDWFLTAKMIKKLHETLFTNDDVLFFDGDFDDNFWWWNGYS